MTPTKLQFAAALCAGIGYLSLPPAQAADEATITSQGATIAALQSQLGVVAGVPKNAALLAQTPVPAPGYTYTGNFVAVSGSAWTYRASMNTARSAFAAAASVGNTLYALGGYNYRGGYFSSVEAIALGYFVHLKN